MSTSIEWTDETWNPFVGCSKVSPGCEHCYAINVAHRGMSPQHRGLTVMMKAGPNWTGEHRFVPSVLGQPLHWRKPRRVFVCSMSDIFHEASVATEEGRRQIAAVFGVMAATPHITYQVLTKRPDQARDWFIWLDRQACAFYSRREQAGVRLSLHACKLSILAECLRRELGEIEHRHGADWPLPNVWLGVTAENQEQANKRIPALLDLPAKVRFVSVEPMLGPVDLCPLTCPGCGGHEVHDEPGCQPWCTECDTEMGNPGWLDPDGIDWVICGGESGRKARPMNPDWARTLRDQCVEAGVPFLFKQWGEYAPMGGGKTCPNCDGRGWVNPEMPCARCERSGSIGVDDLERVGKKAAGRTIDGRTWDEFPEDLRS